jgi:hypothetical protein
MGGHRRAVDAIDLGKLTDSPAGFVVGPAGLPRRSGCSSTSNRRCAGRRKRSNGLLRYDVGSIASAVT